MIRRVFVDHELLVVGTAAAPEAAAAPPAPDAPEALRHLAEAGHELVVVGPEPVELGGDGPMVRWQAELGRGRLSGWYLTADVHRCSTARRSGLRTVLVGPSVPSTMAPERCDREVRDLTAAALEILATDVMGGTGASATVGNEAGPMGRGIRPGRTPRDVIA
ncbi:MAG TPA: hypothetical protein VEY67_05340 [Candidatus Dormibacteraeota bacterium]|nr:hypothetical protein [Candidatus Dormibacteraeota bacterium]